MKDNKKNKKMRLSPEERKDLITIDDLGVEIAPETFEKLKESNLLFKLISPEKWQNKDLPNWGEKEAEDNIKIEDLDVEIAPETFEKLKERNLLCRLLPS